MFLPIYLFWDYISPFPWYLGPILQVLGLILLWVTRFTGRFYPRWGNKYYVFSAIVRPLGILLIAWGWLEMLSVQPEMSALMPLAGWGLGAVIIFILGAIVALYDKFLRGFYIMLIIIGIMLSIVFSATAGVIGFSMILLSLAWAIASIIKLGLRRSFLYVRADDPLITTGPYAYQRHPQFLASIVLVYASNFFLDGNYNTAILDFHAVNFLVLVGSLLLITVGEEKDLIRRFGDEYSNYCKSVPRIVSFGPKGRTLKWWKKILLIFMAFIISIFGIFLLNGLEGRSPIYAATSFYFRHRMNKARTHLAAITTAEVSYFGETNKWGKTFKTIGWEPDIPSRYAYFLNSCDEAIPARNNFKECPSELKTYFENHLLNHEDGFHAAAVLGYEHPSGSITIWVVDKRKAPEPLLKDSKKSRLFRRRGKDYW